MMERVFSVDDILGTFWKLDTQGDGTPKEDHSNGKLSNGFPSSASLQNLHAFQKMSRSSSEFMFQEFMKEHTAGLKAVDSERSLEKFGSMRSLPSVDKLDAFLSVPSESRLDKLEDGSGSNRGVKNSPFGLPESPTAGALNPLFSGLKNEAPPSSEDQGYADYLRNRLVMACAVASTRVSERKSERNLCIATTNPLSKLFELLRSSICWGCTLPRALCGVIPCYGQSGLLSPSLMSLRVSLKLSCRSQLKMVNCVFVSPMRVVASIFGNGLVFFTCKVFQNLLHARAFSSWQLKTSVLFSSFVVQTAELRGKHLSFLSEEDCQLVYICVA